MACRPCAELIGVDTRHRIEDFPTVLSSTARYLISTSKITINRSLNKPISPVPISSKRSSSQTSFIPLLSALCMLGAGYTIYHALLPLTSVHLSSSLHTPLSFAIAQSHEVPAL
ncbi:hypothetical protein BHYA_0068g00190 [Botrytis hyacinthi]|uniref:Uncharacterized protein n=1 Tax=Botrytis hyacinthi TaxID=278943 RepID=A0A4Z1GSZ2_9HELO|nr:hypothetical protein BHYA_0068g00190 [Botrytis hyacinthi]